MTQINYQKLASAEGVLDTLGRRQFPVDIFLKQAAESGIPAWMGAADDVAYYIYVSNTAPGVIKQAQELVYGGQKLASGVSRAIDGALDVGASAPAVTLRTRPSAGSMIDEGWSVPSSLLGDVSPAGRMPSGGDGTGVPLQGEALLEHLGRSNSAPMPGLRRLPNTSNSAGDFSPAASGNYQRGGDTSGAAPDARLRSTQGPRAMANNVYGAAKNNPYLAGGIGALALGAGGVGAYQGLKEDPWYQPALDVLG